MGNMTHWTNRSSEDFLYSIATDFIEQIEEKMEAIGMRQNHLAQAALVSKGYVSRIFKNPGNLSLETIVKFSRSVGMKASILAYEDMNDPDNTRGPIHADIFRHCWQLAGNPNDVWSLQNANTRMVTRTMNPLSGVKLFASSAFESASVFGFTNRNLSLGPSQHFNLTFASELAPNMGLVYPHDGALVEYPDSAPSARILPFCVAKYGETASTEKNEDAA